MISTDRPSSFFKHSRGFTLIEVLIAMFLLALISMAVYNATTQTYKYRQILVTEGDFYNGIRLAMAILERDIEQMYSPVMMNPNYRFPGLEGGPEGDAANPLSPFTDTPPPRGDQASSARAQSLEVLMNSELGQVTDYWLGVADATGIRASRFRGGESNLNFVSASHLRLYKGTNESTFAKVAYELKADNSEDRMPGTGVLVRTEDPNVFDDTEKKLRWSKSYPLLNGVKSLKFRYYRRDKKAWETSWDNSKEFQRGLYPDIVEVTINVEASDRLKFTGTYSFRPELPYRGLPKTF